MRRDVIISGALAGILGNILKTIIMWIFYSLGYVNYTFEHIAAGFFVDAKYLKDPISLIIGFLGDYTLAGVIGVIIFLMLKLTGTDYAKLKGVGFGAVIYVFFFGIAMTVDITRATILTPLANLLPFLPNMIFGGATAWIIKEYLLKEQARN